jgi:hypothetical protein
MASSPAPALAAASEGDALPAEKAGRKRTMSAEARKRIAEAQRKRRAAQKREVIWKDIRKILEPLPIGCFQQQIRRHFNLLGLCPFSKRSQLQ